MRTLNRWSRATGVSVAVTALLALTFPAGAGAAGPDMVSGARASASIPVGATLGEIARLDVGAGTWVAFATLTVAMDAEARPTTNCTIRAVGGDVNDSQAMRATVHVDAIELDTFSADLDGMAGARFSGAGAFTLSCRNDHAGAAARNIRMVALKVADLSRYDMPRAVPPAITADTHAVLTRQPRPLLLRKDVWRTVTAIDLPAGQWWLHASVTAIDSPATQPADLFDSVDCRLELAGDSSRSKGYLFLEGARMFGMDLAGHVEGRLVPMRARVRCRSTVGDITLSGMRLSALRVGHLVRIDAAAGEGQDDGRGDPSAIHQRGADDPTVDAWDVKHTTTVATVPIPAGRWLARVTFSSRDDQQSDGFAQGGMTCTLHGGTAQDTHTVDVPLELPLVSMMTPVRSTSATTVPLRCSLPDATTADLRIIDLRMTVFEVGSISTDPLTD